MTTTTATEARDAAQAAYDVALADMLATGEWLALDLAFEALVEANRVLTAL